MEYLKRTNEILKERSFLRYVSQAYERFIYLDEGAYLDSQNHGYTPARIASIDAWLDRCKSLVPTRAYSGANITFKEYVGYSAQGRIKKDWQIFEDNIRAKTGANRDKATNDLMAEVGKAIETIKSTPYLVPIQKYILETLNGIKNHYKAKPMVSKKQNIKSQQEPERIRWNAKNTLLYGLILDLAASRLPNGNHCLSASYPRLVKLIVDNFEDANGKHFTAKDVGTYLRKRPKRIAEKIRIDVSDTVQIDDPFKKKKR